MDDGELFLEYSQSESVAFDDGRIKSAVLRHDAGLRPARASPARRPATPMPPSSRRRRSAAPATRCGRSRPGHGGTFDGAADRHQPQPLYRRQSAGADRFRRQGEALGRDRRLCARPGPARAPGLGLARRASGRRCRSSAPTARRVGDIRPLVRLNVSDRRRRGRPHGDRLVRRRRPRRLRSAISIRRNGARRSTRRCARRWSISARCRRRPAR